MVLLIKNRGSFGRDTGYLCKSGLETTNFSLTEGRGRYARLSPTVLSSVRRLRSSYKSDRTCTWPKLGMAPSIGASDDAPCEQSCSRTSEEREYKDHELLRTLPQPLQVLAGSKTLGYY